MEFAIPEIRALVRRPDRDAAQRLLEKIADEVLPVMTKRRFRVRRLREFFPKHAQLLGMNVNRGATIYIRLRPQSRPESFLPYEALLETMLHELTHMVHGPHNQAFYKYLDELKHELESFMVRGLVGHEGARFHDAGHGFSIQTETTAIAVRHANDNRAAVLAAARREKYHRLLGGVTSQRLGSSLRDGGHNDGNTVVLTSQQLRARALDAAERRRRDSQACSLTVQVTNAIEVLGIDDSSEDEQEKETTHQRGQRIDDAIEISDDDGDSTERGVVLVDDEDEHTVVDLTDD